MTLVDDQLAEEDNNYYVSVRLSKQVQVRQIHNNDITPHNKTLLSNYTVNIESFIYIVKRKTSENDVCLIYVSTLIIKQ